MKGAHYIDETTSKNAYKNMKSRLCVILNDGGYFKPCII